MLIRPEFHADSGRMEGFILTARNALTYEESPEDCFARLERDGASTEEAFLATTAARLLLGEP